MAIKAKISKTAKTARIVKTAKSVAKVQETQKTRVRIKVRGYDYKVLDRSVQQIIDIIERHGGEVAGPIPLPTEIRKYTVNRSSFVHKDSREQFEIRIHKRLLDITNPSSRIIDSLMSLALPSGIDIEIKMM